MCLRLLTLAGLVLSACAPPPAVDGAVALDRRGLAPQWDALDVELPGAADDDVVAFVAGRGAAMGLGAAQLAVAGRSDGEGGRSHVRLRQSVDGVPVLGGDVVVHLHGRRVVATGGTLAGRVDVDTRPRVSAAAARASLLAHLQGAPRQGGLAFDRSRLALEQLAEPTLVVVRTAAGDRLAWRSASLIDDDAAPAEVEALVDAHGGGVLQAANVLETATGTGRSLYLASVSIPTARVNFIFTSSYELRDVSGLRTRSSVKNMYGTTVAWLPFLDSDNVWGNFSTSNTATVAVDAHFGTVKALD